MSTSPNAEPSAAPQGPTRYFAGYRILLGLAVSALGAFALHWTHDPELSAFAIVTSVAGAVVSVWGYVATLISPKASREDVTWASLFFAVIVSLTAGNIYFNREDYGLPLAGIELAIAGGCFMVARTVAFVYSRITKSWVKDIDWKRRRNALVLCAGIFGLMYLPVRLPLMALVHLEYFGDVNSGYGEAVLSDQALSKMPRFVLTWAVERCLDGSKPGLRKLTLLRAIEVREVGDAIPTASLASIVLTSSYDEIRRTALSLIEIRSAKAATQTAKSVLRTTNPPGQWFDAVCSRLIIENCSVEDFELLWRRESKHEPTLRRVFEFRRADLLFHAITLRQSATAMQDIVQLAAGSEWFVPTGPSLEAYQLRVMTMMSSSDDPKIRAGLFSFWSKPAEVSLVYDEYWRRFPRTLRMLFTKALSDPDLDVRRAAAKKFIAIIDNPYDLPITRADLATDDGVRAAATKLLPKLEEARPE